MKHLIKQIFCKHTFEICKFPVKLPGEEKEKQYNCIDVTGWALHECTKCGKTKVIKMEE